jgi:hypothetical protein
MNHLEVDDYECSGTFDTRWFYLILRESEDVVWMGREEHFRPAKMSRGI